MNIDDFDISKLSIEQKIILHLANQGYITTVGDVALALEDQKYADYLVTGNGLSDEIVECDHESLSNDEIQVVFDNDNDEKSLI